MISELILSGLISISSSDKSVLNDLEVRLKKEKHSISQYTKDPRFEIYKFKGRGKAVNYADTTKTWYMKSDSIKKCANFIEEHYYWLKKAEEEFGPSPEYITSQLQLETNKGQNTGKYPVINALVSMYVNRPDRRNEFYIYLKEFLSLVSDTTYNIILPKDIFEIKGSWAGAYGIAQMMPDILRKYGKISDFDGDGFFDPMSFPDAIGFLGRYLEDKGFNKNKSRAVQMYNWGDYYYGMSIGKHTIKLTEIMEKKRRIPPEKITSFQIPKLFCNKSLDTNKLQPMKPLMISQLTEKQFSLKQNIFNKRNGRR